MIVVIFFLFSHSALVENTRVTLPNGDNVAIDRIGIVKLSHTLILQNVLLFPCLPSISLALVPSLIVTIIVLMFSPIHVWFRTSLRA